MNKRTIWALTPLVGLAAAATAVGIWRTNQVDAPPKPRPSAAVDYIATGTGQATVLYNNWTGLHTETVALPWRIPYMAAEGNPLNIAVRPTEDDQEVGCRIDVDGRLAAMDANTTMALCRVYNWTVAGTAGLPRDDLPTD